MNRAVYNTLIKGKEEGRKHFAVLIDPDKNKLKHLEATVSNAVDCGVDFFFLGGSLLMDDVMDKTIRFIKQHCDIPLILFPGSTIQINPAADAILLLSLISGRNPELLIGKHVEAAPYLIKSKLEVISTAYILIDGGAPTTASYISNTTPIPYNKPDIAACTAMAGELLGMHMTFMDTGSGGKFPISEEMIATVRSYTQNPLVVGGGIRTPEKAFANTQAGADLIVVGDAIEKEPGLMAEIADAIHAVRKV